MTKKILLLIGAGLFLSACSLTAAVPTSNQTEIAPSEVMTGAPSPTMEAGMKTFMSADLTDQQLDKDMAAADKELSTLEKNSSSVDASFNDTPIDVNK